MLRLAKTSDPNWAKGAVEHIDEILIDHAHLEKKAASTALQMIFRYSQYPQILRPLSELAREELEHFELVLKVLEERGIHFEPIRPSPYAGKLRTIERTKDPERLLDTLLCCAVIEARSCERMKILAEALGQDPLARLYRGLLAAEARHHQLYVDLAKSIFNESEVEARLGEITEHEAKILEEPSTLIRLHGPATAVTFGEEPSRT